MREIQFSPPDITEEEIAAVSDTLRSGWITTGPKTKNFEAEIASYCHTSMAVALNSATACMESTLYLLGVGAGDEVITSAYTYSASASVIAHAGAKIVMVDCGVDSFLIDYDAIEAAITEHTKVIIPVDIGGIICDYDRIYKILERKKHLFRPSTPLQKIFGRVIVLADSAHSFGASSHGKRCGELADFTSFSFHAVKNLTTGEGGAVVWKDIPGIENEELYNQYMLYSLHGQSKDAMSKSQLGAWEYDIAAPLYKCNMTDITASLGLVQLSRYPGLLARRKALINRYMQRLEGLPVSWLCHYDEDNASSGHLFLLRLTGKDEEYRDQVIIRMANEGVATNVHYKPLPMHTAYKNLGFAIENFPNAYAMYQNEITLPLHTLLTDEDVDYVAQALRESL